MSGPMLGHREARADRVAMTTLEWPILDHGSPAAWPCIGLWHPVKQGAHVAVAAAPPDSVFATLIAAVVRLGGSGGAGLCRADDALGALLIGSQAFANRQPRSTAVEAVRRGTARAGCHPRRLDEVLE